jgi:hypothetical protein
MTDRKRHDPDELEPEKIPQRLVRVHDVPDEGSGTMLADFLRGQGITATVQRIDISMLPGVESGSHGYWGHVEVLESDATRARTLIRDFLAQRPEGIIPGNGPGAGDDDGPEDAA